jgi:CHAT domain-containing protein/tetratricopeptide (TPR) repeat protein
MSRFPLLLLACCTCIACPPLAATQEIVDSTARDPSSQWTSLISRAEASIDRGETAAAESLAMKALQIAGSAFGESDRRYPLSQVTLALVYQKTGNLSAAESLYVRGMPALEKLLGGEHPALMQYTSNLAGLYDAQGRNNDADTCYVKVLKLMENTLGSDNAQVASFLNGLGQRAYELGRAKEAEQYLGRALAISEKILGKDHIDVAAILEKLGDVYCTQGLLADAEAAHRRALTIEDHSLGGEHPAIAASLCKVAGLCEQLGRPGEAEQLYKRALFMYEKNLGDVHPRVADALVGMALCCYRQRRYDEVEPLLHRAIAIREVTLGPEHPEVGNALDGLATLYRRVQKRYGEAESLGLRALMISEKAFGKDDIAIVRCLNNLALIYTVEGRSKDAEEKLLRALAICDRYGVLAQPLRAATLSNLVQSLMTQERYAEAEPFILEAHDVLMAKMSENLGPICERERLAFYNTLRYGLDRFMVFVVHRMLENPRIISKAFDSRLATRGLLLNSVRGVLQHSRSSKDTALIPLLDRWIAARNQLAGRYLVSVRRGGLPDSTADSLENVANALERDLTRLGWKPDTVRDESRVTWKKLQAALQTGEAAIDIVRFLEPKRDTPAILPIRYAAMIITPDTKDHPDLVLLDNGASMEGKYCAQYRRAIAVGKSLGPRGVKTIEPEEDADGDSTLYSVYWEEIQKALPGIRRVYLSVDGIYNTVNLEALRMPNGAYLGDLCEIQVLTSLKDLLADHKPTTQDEGRSTAELFGFPRYSLKSKSRQEPIAPLPGTEREIRQIDSLLKRCGWISRLHLQEEATEGNVKTISAPRVLHIATHGFFEPDPEEQALMDLEGAEIAPSRNPMLRSGLLLAGAEDARDGQTVDRGSSGDEDGTLTAYEAMTLDLENTELVVLSACETGLGDVHDGDGVYGLQRALQVAGARHLLMSLWKVDDDATRELMSGFYAKWAGGSTMRQAFRDAQRELRASYPQPFYWGAFVMVGD